MNNSITVSTYYLPIPKSFDIINLNMIIIKHPSYKLGTSGSPFMRPEDKLVNILTTYHIEGIPNITYNKKPFALLNRFSEFIFLEDEDLNTLRHNKNLPKDWLFKIVGIPEERILTDEDLYIHSVDIDNNSKYMIKES